MSQILRKEDIVRIVILDTVLISIVLIVPVVVHALGFSTRYIEPMRLSLFASVLLASDRKNAYLLAIILPLLSMCVIGMPVWHKAVLMSVELCANVFLYYRMCGWNVNSFVAVLISIVGSKVLYYFLKFILIQLALIPQSTLIGNLVPQLIAAVMIAVLFYGFANIKKR